MLLKENDRLAILDLYKILDSGSEQAFDDLSILAANICDTPISSISFISSDRQWFKSSVGFDLAETPRDVSFCSKAIEYQEMTIVNDMQLDARFKDLPGVTRDGIRFYAGVPLEVRSGVRLGTLCVMDLKPRELSKKQISSLKTLARCVVAQLDLRRAKHDLDSLNEILPMCAWCRKIRIEDQENEPTWQPLDEYVMSVTPVTHCICSNCSKQFD